MKFRNLIIVAGLLSILPLIHGCGGAPKKEDVAASIKTIMPVNFEIVEIKPLDAVPGLFQVSVKVDKQPIVLYVDKKAKYLVSGSIMEIKTKQNLTAEAQKALAGK